MRQHPRAQAWTPDELATLRALYPHRSAAHVAGVLGRGLRSVYQKAASLGIRKTDKFFSSAEAGRLQRAQRHRVVGNQFKPGQKPWNKGTKGAMPAPAPGKGFQPGHVPHTHRPIGTERRDRDDHLVRKVSDTRDKKADWQPVRNIVWRTHFGEMPPGWFVICLDRDPDNLEPGNLVLVDRAENMRRNSYHNRHPELAPLYQLKGAINRQLTRINKRNPP